MVPLSSLSCENVSFSKNLLMTSSRFLLPNLSQLFLLQTGRQTGFSGTQTQLSSETRLKCHKSTSGVRTTTVRVRHLHYKQEGRRLISYIMAIQKKKKKITSRVTIFPLLAFPTFFPLFDAHSLVR